MKELVITLLILVGWIKLKIKNITIYESCYTWYQKNEMTERKTTLFSRRSYHLYQGQRVVGYILCSDKDT